MAQGIKAQDWLQQQLRKPADAKAAAAKALADLHAQVLNGEMTKPQEDPLEDQEQHQTAPAKQRKGLEARAAMQAKTQLELEAAQAVERRRVLTEHRAGMSGARQPEEEPRAAALAQAREGGEPTAGSRQGPAQRVADVSTTPSRTHPAPPG